jgi:hypothetical protein
MLRQAAIDVVAQGQFHIYSADLVSEGTALFMNTPFETVLSLSQGILQIYRQLCQVNVAHDPMPNC